MNSLYLLDEALLSADLAVLTKRRLLHHILFCSVCACIVSTLKVETNLR